METSFGNVLHVNRMAADQTGVLNLMIISAIASGLSCFLIWIFAYQFAALTIFATVYGFSSGTLAAQANIVLFIDCK